MPAKTAETLRAASVETRKKYVSALKQSGVSDGKEFAGFTDIIYVTLFDAPAKRLRKQRGITERESLRDHFQPEQLEMVLMTEEAAAAHFAQNGTLDKDDVQRYAIASRSSIVAARATNNLTAD